MLKHSFSFVERIRDVKASNTFLASFDVKSLFTNVPLREFIDICTDKLYMLKKPILSKDSFVKLLKFSLNNNMYAQHDGVAIMGSPLKPTLANIFMGFLESKIISSCVNKKQKLCTKLNYLKYYCNCEYICIIFNC